MILRLLPGPFFGWLGTLVFLLLMQFLIHHLPDIAGKGLPLGVILELISYSLAYMVVLAVPMSVLLTTLMTFGRLSETNAYAVIKSSGISLWQLTWPVFVAGLLVAGSMAYFNNVVLPESNFRAKNLWKDIRTKKPGFELQPGVFYEGLSDYSILVEETVPHTNDLRGVTIYDYTEGARRQTVIKAERGRLETLASGTRIQLTLFGGEVHRLLPPDAKHRQPRYERLAFEQHRLGFDLSDFLFERSSPRESYRSDRTMHTSDMIRVADSLRARADEEVARLREAAPALADAAPDASAGEPPTALPAQAPDSASGAAAEEAVPVRRVALAGLGAQAQERVYGAALSHARTARTRIDDAQREIAFKRQRADRYQVEIYKKNSIALACLIFVLVGAPLGLSIRRGGLGTVAGLALGIFLFYWVTLVQGEKLADRGLLPPWVGMWIANIALLGIGAWLAVYVTLDLRATPPLWKRLWQRIRSAAA